MVGSTVEIFRVWRLCLVIQEGVSSGTGELLSVRS